MSKRYSDRITDLRRALELARLDGDQKKIDELALELARLIDEKNINTVYRPGHIARLGARCY